MKAIRVHEFGGPEVLKLEDFPTPKPSKGEVLVRIHAIGVNPYDTYMRAGTYPLKPALPYTPGSDAGGVVEAIGEGVSKVKTGDRIYTAQTITGAYAEYTLALEGQVHPLPEKIDFKQGAGVWVPYGTAYHALRHQAKARPSETLLAQVEVSASQRFKSHVQWACTLLALLGRRRVWSWSSARAHIAPLIIATPDIRTKSSKERPIEAQTSFWKCSPT